MSKLAPFGAAGVLLVLSTAAPAAANTPLERGAVATVSGIGANGAFPVLTRGQVVFVNAQRLVVTQEPPPVAQSSEAPPAPQSQSAGDRGTAPSTNAIWVDGHWMPGESGFTWVSGRFINRRPGLVFVPPRWAVLDDQFLFFNGFFVPYGVFVRSHFNKFFFSGTRPGGSQRVDRGPYWPVGVPSRGRPLTSANARDPYWPVGAPTPANSPFRRAPTSSPYRPVGLR